MDSNAHSTLWAPDSNRRGDIIDEFIFDYGLRVDNVGTKPTFQARGVATTIDITLSLNLGPLTDWRVGDVITLSDHNQIEFEIEFQGKKTNKVTRNLKKARWDIFRKEMERRDGLWEASRKPYWTKKRLDTEALSLSIAINSAVAKACPIQKVREGYKLTTNWSPETCKARKRAKALLRAYRRTNDDATFTAYIEAKLHFRSLYRRSDAGSWKKFCTDSPDPKSVARLTKVIQGQENKTLGLLAKDSGGTTESPAETIDLLMDTHFPGSVSPVPNSFTRVEAGGGFREGAPEESQVSYITATKVRAAIASFGAHKAAGPDGIKPVVLQHLGDSTLSRITSIFKACLLLKYTPKSWRTSKVIFIPKPGKDDYGKAKSFRPISLTPFLFKTLERVVLWELEGTTLRDHPLSRSQHAFRKGSSTESALSGMVDTIESSILRGEFAIGVFLDIQGAFDNLPISAAVKGMELHNFPPLITGWYAHYLGGRIATTEVKGQTARRGLTRGTPQGGVLSPLIWNTAFDSLLDLFTEGPVEIMGFADDAALVIRGIDPPSMRDLIQNAVNVATDWGADNGLTFGPSKTVAVVFTRKRNVPELKPLKVKGVEIPYSTSAKYLGITLDRKLDFKQHITGKVKKAKSLLHKFRNAAGHLWGPSPLMTRWVFTGIVRPMLTYGSLVWAPAAERYTAELRKLQALAMRSLTHIRRSAPVQGLEVITFLMPLDLFIRGEAAMAALRVRKRNPVKWQGFDGSRPGHLHWAGRILVDAKCEGLSLDSSLFSFNWEKHYTVVRDSFMEGNPIEAPDVSVATDGSKLDSGTGWGFCAYRDGSVLTSARGGLGEWATVFQGEITAIYKACLALLDVDAGSVFFFVDSQAALLALDKMDITSKTVGDCIQALNRLGRKTTVYLRWVKAHVGHEQNEAADALAKEGATFDLDDHALPVSKKVLKGILNEYLEKEWNKRWEDYEGGRETKLWFPHPHKSFSKKLLKGTNRELYGKVIQAVTGHCYLNYHHNVRIVKTPRETAKCRFCGDNKETPEHLIMECDALWRVRQDCFLSNSLCGPSPIWVPQQLLRFLRDPHMEEVWRPRGAE